ncbi:MAG: hypothetical protein HC872_02690 [Gammaproteobacteria bacterium]|nr:hypothetical protein [Gammaproteobacteria bacterium]
MPPRKKESPLQQRRQQLLRDRDAAMTLGNACPSASQLRLDLTFHDTTALTPTAQSYVVYPPAQAFFEYPCPYSDCDGTFDLGSVVKGVLAKSSAQVEGTLSCAGVRSRDRLQRQPCGLKVTYTVTLNTAPRRTR